MRGTPHGRIIKTKAALAAAPDAMKCLAALSAGQPPKFDNDHRAFHGNLRRLCTDIGQHIPPQGPEDPGPFAFASDGLALGGWQGRDGVTPARDEQTGDKSLVRLR